MSPAGGAFAAFALIAICLAAGYLFRRFEVFPRDASDTLNRFVVYVSLPAVILRVVPALTWEPGLAVLVVTPWASMMVGAVLVLLLARVFHFSRSVIGALLLCVPLGNTSFLGFPMVGALLGPDAVRLAVLYDQLGSFLMLATYGLFVAARFAGDGGPSGNAILLRVAKFPPFVGLIIALLPFPHPPVEDAILKPLGDTLVPLAVFAVGLKLEVRAPKYPLPLALGLLTKMVLLPLVAVAITGLFGSPKGPRDVAILESAMPPMITAAVLATMEGLAPELATDLVAYGIVLSFGTLPLVAMLLR